MNLRYRRIIYVTFFALFLIITPLVILYATGYRYDFKRHYFVKTGILYIDSKPTGAAVELNGEYQNTTPVRFGTLLPDTYRIDITRDGYHSITKNFEVKSNLTTFGRDFVLFKNVLPINFISASSTDLFIASPNHEKILFSIIVGTTEKIQLLNLRNQNVVPINQFDIKSFSTLKFIGWSPDQNRALLDETIGSSNRYLIIDTETLKIRDLGDITRLNFDHVRWDGTNNSILYGSRSHVLYQINLADGSATNSVSELVSDFYGRGNELYYIAADQTGTFLHKRTQTAGQTTDEKIMLPQNSHMIIDPAPNGYLVLQNTNSNDLFILKTDAFTSEDINQSILLQSSAKKVVWSSDNKMILYFTDFELSTFDFTTQQNLLITRLGQIITAADWYVGNKYILFQTGDSVHAIEAWPEDVRNDLALTELTHLNAFDLDGSGKILYLSGMIGPKPGIFQLQLQD